MKYIITLMMLSGFASAQITPTQQEINSRKEASLATLAPHHLLTTFIGEDVNNATVPLQEFMDKYMHMSVGDDANSYKVTKLKSGMSQFKIIFKEHLSTKTITLNITTRHQDSLDIIQTCYFNGDTKRLIDFFVDYWNTTLNFDERKSGEIANRHLWGETASFIYTNPSAKIVVAKN